MADTKISALPASTTPLTGTEVLPVVQSGTTKNVAVSDLTAGRAVSVSTLTSTVATGTAPFTVTSTTEVANLKSATATTATNATNIGITNDTSTTSDIYPVLSGASSGNNAAKVSATDLSYRPSTGQLNSRVNATKQTQTFSGTKTLAASTATTIFSSTQNTASTNMTFRVKLNAIVTTNSGGTAYSGESSEWIVNFNTYGGSAQTPTVTKLNAQAWSASAGWISTTYDLTVSNSGYDITFSATQTATGSGISPVDGAVCVYSVELLTPNKTTFTGL